MEIELIDSLVKALQLDMQGYDTLTSFAGALEDEIAQEHGPLDEDNDPNHPESTAPLDAEGDVRCLDPSWATA